MIDRNCMIDRRIVLEAKLLRGLGHRVALAAAYGVLGENEREIDGLPILRFNETEATPYGPDPDFVAFEKIWSTSAQELPLLRAALAQAYDERSGLRFNAVLKVVRRILGRYLALAVASVFAPRFAARRLLASQKAPTWLQYVGVVFFALLALDIPLLSKVPRLLRGRHRTRSPTLNLRIAELKFRISCAEVALMPTVTGAQEWFRRVRRPRYGLEQLRKSDHPLRVLAGALLVFITLDLFLITRIRRFSQGDFPFIVRTPSGLEGMPEPIVAHFSAQPLDAWEQSVLDFACGLDHIDLVHAHDLPALRTATLIAQKRKIPLVYDAHELYSYQPGIVGERQRRLFDTEHALIPFVDEVICINADQAMVMQKDHGPGSYTPLTNATERPEGFDPAHRYAKVQEHLGLAKDTPTMLFMGGINKGRKIDQLLAGMALAQAQPHMIFLTWGMEIPEFRQQAQDLGIAHRVHFLDPIPWSEIVLWAASVDVGVMPYQALDLNTRISSPNKMYEFIAACTPMIGSTELVNVRRVVEPEGFGVLVPLHGPEDYALAIDTMFDPELGGPLRFKENLLRHSERYLWQAESQGFAQTYGRLFSPGYPAKALAS